MGHSYLSSKAETRVSEISGKGTYAVSNIAKNEMIAIFGGKVMDNDTWQKFEDKLGVLALPLDENFVIGPYTDEESGDGDYINHSCNPNSGIRGQVCLVALRDIKVGEEITFDYAMILADMPPEDCEIDCNCQHDECRGRVTSDDWKNPELQKRYKGYFSHYIQKKIDELERDEA
jgi:SET domain-containing protein